MKMQLRPQPWTHHHAHRLFHISLGLCFGLAALVMATGMVVNFRVGAAEVVDQDDVEITATVSGINPGPTDTPPTTGGIIKPPITTSNPVVTIVAEPQGQIPGRNIGTTTNPVPAYVFSTVNPAFSGTTSVPNGLIFIYIDGPTDLNSTARADVHGYWSWQSPDALLPGTYTITAVVFDSYDLTRSGRASVYFVVELPKQPVEPGQPIEPGQQPGGQPGQPGGQPTVPGGPGVPPVIPPSTISNQAFGVFFQITDNYKTVEVGKKVVGWVSLVSNLDKQIANQDVTYSIIGPNGKVILETKDTVSFSGLAQYTKTFNIAPMTPSGKYTVRVSSTYNGIESIVSDTFILSEPLFAAGVASQGPAVVWSLLILLFLLFLVLVYFAYRYVRHHTRELQPNEEPL